MTISPGGRVRRALYVLAGLLVAGFILFPISIAYVVTHVAPASVPAANLGTAYEDVQFTTSDGFLLKGWYVPSKNRAAVISFPGRSGTRLQARMLARHGYGVLLFDRRGEGESEGDWNVFGWQGERDLHAAVTFLQRPGRRRSGAHRGNRALGRRRDADRGGGGVGRVQGRRQRRWKRAIGSGRAGEPLLAR